MIIKLLEQPIITTHEAEVAGTVDGVIIKGSKVSCIYHRDMEKHFVIPVEKAIIGSDAVMIRDMTTMTLASKNVKPLKSMLDVYNIYGKYLGYLHGIEVDDDFIVRHIFTEEYRIEMSKTVNYESVIVVDIEEAELEPITPEAACLQTEPEKVEAVVPETVEEAPSMDIGPDIKWNDDNCQSEENSLESSELSVIKTVHQNEEKANDIPGVDPKYAYLCGKQLLEGIDMDDTFYDKGTVIDADLIKHAIGSNAIVKVIVNAED